MRLARGCEGKMLMRLAGECIDRVERERRIRSKCMKEKKLLQRRERPCDDDDDDDDDDGEEILWPEEEEEDLEEEALLDETPPPLVEAMVWSFWTSMLMRHPSLRGGQGWPAG